jgi:hypothetical protein
MKKLTFAGICLFLLIIIFSTYQIPAQAAPPAQLTVFPTPTPGPDGKIIYIVQEDDTLWRISAITGVSIDELRDLNKLGPEDPIRPGDHLLIGLAGPVDVIPTPGPSPTPAPQLPTPSPEPGWGIVCIILYNDINGDSLRQEDEPSIPDGAISLNKRLGGISFTADTPSGGISPDAETPEELGFTCFEELPEGEYNVTVAVPEGYNPTTELNQVLIIVAGDEVFISFGAQANSETLAEIAIVPESPRRSPVLGIAGGLILVIGIGLGIYALLYSRSIRLN